MGFLSKMFGGGKAKADDVALDIIETTLKGIFDKGQFNLNYEISDDEKGNISIELFGEDEKNLTDREGQLLDAFQLYLKRVLQHNLPDLKVNVNCDANGFREESNEELIKIADKLKNIALDKGRSVYVRALPPKDRKVIHQHLAEDGRVKSKSVGEGHFKKIKIFPAKGEKGGERGDNRGNRGSRHNEEMN